MLAELDEYVGARQEKVDALWGRLIDCEGWASMLQEWYCEAVDSLSLHPLINPPVEEEPTPLGSPGPAPSNVIKPGEDRPQPVDIDELNKPEPK